MGEVALPGLFYVGVGHACYVVGYGSGDAFFLSAGQVVRGQEFRVGGPCVEESFDDFRGVFVFCVEGRRLVEAGIQEAFGLMALGFHFGAEAGEAFWGAADVVQRLRAYVLNLLDNFLHEVGDHAVEHLLESFVGEQNGLGSGVLGLCLCVKTGEERDLVENVSEIEDACGEAVFNIRRQVGDFVGEVDELCFEGRELIEEVFA